MQLSDVRVVTKQNTVGEHEVYLNADDIVHWLAEQPTGGTALIDLKNYLDIDRGDD